MSKHMSILSIKTGTFIEFKMAHSEREKTIVN